MSFTAKIEEKINELIGVTPCKDTDSNFYYQISQARKGNCCVFVLVELFINSCLDDIMNRICNINTNIQWTITRNVDNPNDDDSYIANITIGELQIDCECDKASGIIQEVITTVN